MRRIALSWAAAWAALAVAAPIAAKVPDQAVAGHLDLPPVNVAAEVAKASADSSGPFRYGLPTKVGAAEGLGLEAGLWSKDAKGQSTWRLSVSAPGAVSLDFVFRPLRLPAGASLVVRDAKGQVALGPYTDANNKAHGVLATPVVAGGQAVIEITLPEERVEFLEFRLDQVVRGFRGIWSVPVPGAALPKAQACNVDVACPQAQSWADQTNAAARYAFSGSLCSGQLLANAEGDRTERLFATANHCVSTNADAQSMVFYWRYQSATCRTPGSAASGQVLPLSIAAATQSGAQLVANHPASDFTLVRLDDAIPNEALAFLGGWDRGADSSQGVAGIHHPSGHEKRISLEADGVFPTDTQVTYGTGPDAIVLPPGNAWFVEAWDEGTTEGGSSGSGLWNADRRLIGVLSGGSFGCGNFDHYGRLKTAWEGGGTPSSRIRDWLDPMSRGVQAVDGTSICDAPDVQLQSPAFSQLFAAGETVSFTASASGGSGTLAYEWDLDGLEGFEVGNRTSVSLAYPDRRTLQVAVRVTDSEGCSTTVSRALDIAGPRFSAAIGTPDQICGDGDAILEPGERWRLPITLNNVGNATFADGGFALFVPGSAGGSEPLPLTDAGISGSLGAADDGRASTAIALRSGTPVLGADRAVAVMSTNGYLSFDDNDTGGDFNSDCAGLPNNGSLPPRLHVLHDDLVVGSGAGAGLRHRFFADCPRAGESAQSNQGCHVFQWSGMQLWNNVEPEGNFEFQAVLYPGSGEIAYQYQSPDPLVGDGATIGLVGTNPDQDLLNASCGEAGLPTAGTAVCLFPDGSEPAGGLPFSTQSGSYSGTSSKDDPGACGFAFVDLKSAGETGEGLIVEAAPPLPAIGAGAQGVTDIELYIDADADCGAPIELGFLGAANATQSAPSDGSTVFSTTLGAGGACQVSSCPAPARDDARYGLYFQGSRPGNGLLHFVYEAGDVDAYGGVWYTARGDRLPTWYTLQGPQRGDLAATELRAFSNTAAPSGFAPEGEVVGRAWVAQAAEETVLIAWDFDQGGHGIEQLGTIGLPFSSPNRTQLWFNPGEAGWGIGIESNAIPGGGYNEFMAAFLFDAAGNPRWVVGGDDAESGALDAVTFRVHCPGCPFVTDQMQFPLDAGSFSRSYTGFASGLLDSDIVLPAPLNGSWSRDQLPIQPIAEPEQP